MRIAGVEVGKVKKVEAVEGGKAGGAAIVTMELKKSALPIHEDAQLKIRPRVFLEGNFFVDIKPGSPSADTLKSGRTIPTTQTAAPVQFGDVLAALQSDTRSDLQVFLKEYSKGLEGKGAEGFNEALRTGPRAFRSTAVASDALLGLEPTKDLQRVFRGQARTFAALNEDEEALKGLVTNFNTVAGAFASQDAALERVGPGAGPHPPSGLARAGVAELGVAHPARVLARGAAGRAFQRADAGSFAALHPPGPPARGQERAARRRPPAAPADPELRHAQPPVAAAAGPGPRAVLVHQSGAGALGQHARFPTRTSPSRTTRSRCGRPTAASSAWPVRAA